MLRRRLLKLSWLVALVLPIALGQGVSGMPGTEGETLSGKRVHLNEVVAGHATVLVMGFSKEAGDGCTDWARAVRGDTALKGAQVWGVAMLAGAPGFIRGVIKAGMRKGLSPAEQDAFVVLERDEQPWRAYFGVVNDKEPQVALLDTRGKVVWRGHGMARELEGELRAAFVSAGGQAVGQR